MDGEGSWLKWGAILFILVLLSCNSAWATWRVWHGKDASAGAGGIVGKSGAAPYNAMLTPLAPAMFLLTAAMVSLLVWPAVTDEMPSIVRALAGYAALIAVLLIFLSIFVFLFMRPKFIIPPHLHGERGLVAALWHETRQSRNRNRQ